MRGLPGMSYTEHVLVIRDAQMKALALHREGRFERRLVESVKRLWPAEHAARGGDAGVAQAVRSAVEDGRRHGLESERDLLRLTHLWWMLGDSLSVGGEHEWARAVLADPSLAPSAKLEAIFARLVA